MAEIWKAWALLHKRDERYFEAADDGWVIPYITRLRGSEKNVPLAADVAKRFFRTPPRVLHGILYFNTKPDAWCKTPRPTKARADKRVEALTPHLQRLYGWSTRELALHQGVVQRLAQDEEFLQALNTHAALEKKELRTLGIKERTAEQPTDRRAQSRSIFSF